jgi:hypothetical protein
MYNGGEVGKVFKTKHTHWKHTASTTMTFATRVKTLKEDMDVWLKHTQTCHPHDHFAFTELKKSKGRTVACSIPGWSWHADLTESMKYGQLMFDINCLYFLVDRLSNYAGHYDEDEAGAEYIDNLKWEVTKAFDEPWGMKALVPLIMLQKELEEKKNALII